MKKDKNNYKLNSLKLLNLSLTLNEEHNLRLVEEEMLRRILGSK
jgi:hypothetical protein